jgi:hypothetical protein
MLGAMGVRARMASALLFASALAFASASAHSANVDASVAVEGVREAAGARRDDRDDTPQISPSEHCAEEPLQYVSGKYVCE